MLPLSSLGWCRVSKVDYISQLPEVDRLVLHYPGTHTDREEGHIFEVFLTRSAYTEGTRDQWDGWAADLLYVDGQAMTRSGSPSTLRRYCGSPGRSGREHRGDRASHEAFVAR